MPHSHATRTRQELFIHRFAAMGSPCEVKIFAASLWQADHIAALIDEELRRIEQKYSRYLDSSELSRINRAAAQGASVTIDPETEGLLHFASLCFEKSNGLFDITSGLLQRIWDFRTGAYREDEKREDLLSRIGMQHLSLRQGTLSFARTGMELDLGGIGKEYAVDRALDILTEEGVAHGLINLGGDLAVSGPMIDGSPWEIGIEDPRRPTAMLGTISLSAGAVATSGNYRKVIEKDGQQFSHFLHPKTGRPVIGLASVSVVAPNCMTAGAVSTLAMLRDDEDGLAFLDNQPLPYLALDRHGVLHDARDRALPPL